MENATKALLIAAAVLIAIVLIALGVLLIGNASNTSEQAQKVGDSIGVATDDATLDAMTGIRGTIISKEKFNDFIDDFSSKYSGNYWKVVDEVQKKNSKLSNQIEVMGYVYKGSEAQYLNSMSGEEYSKSRRENYNGNWEESKKFFDFFANTWCKKGDKVMITDPTKEDNVIKKLREVWAEGTGNQIEEFDEETPKKYIRWAFGYDELGYINKAVYLATVKY